MTCNRLFVYGTLRRFVPESKADMFSDGATYLTTGRTIGKLYRISWHPGMTPGEAGDWVTGEIWKLSNPAETFRILDEYEGPDYERIVVSIEVEDGEQLEAWTYFYKAPVEGKARIESGDWADAAGSG